MSVLYTTHVQRRVRDDPTLKLQLNYARLGGTILGWYFFASLKTYRYYANDYGVFLLIKAQKSFNFLHFKNHMNNFKIIYFYQF